MLAACPGPKAPDANLGSGSGDQPPSHTETPVDAPEPSQEERLAAIQKAMNELDEAAQACWASAAVERFDIEGEIAALIEIEKDAAKVTFARDTTRNKKLGACLTALLEHYRWAPPLVGQSIELPFKFRAPDGQNVIDRTLVPWVSQGKVAVAVLLDENNTGNGAASILELAIAAGGTTGARIPERNELWFFLGDGTVEAGTTKRAVHAGDMMYVPANVAARAVSATADMHAAIVMVPGGREGSARAGALPTKELGPIKSAIGGPMFLPAGSAKTYQPPGRGSVTIFAEPSITKDASFAASIIELAGNAKIPEHVHAKETELLYVLAGSGTLTVNGVDQAIVPTSTVQIPPNTKHAFTATADFRAVQIYTPAGPEQRFKAAK
jgi:quercetin dioxygenase-like cupin family protein